jgi:hypothetical protein
MHTEMMKKEASDEFMMLLETLRNDRILMMKIERYIALVIFLESNKGKRSAELAALRKEKKNLSPEITREIETKTQKYINSQPENKSVAAKLRYAQSFGKYRDKTNVDIKKQLQDIARKNLSAEEPDWEAKASEKGKELKKDANLQKRRKAARRKAK